MTYSPADILLAETALSLYDAAGSKLLPHLLDTFGSATAVFGASADELVRKAGIKPELAGRIACRECFHRAEAQLGYCRLNGLEPVNLSSEYYPPLLRECCDMPLVLYVMGDPAVLTGDMLAVVGTRKMSQYGAWVCEQSVAGLSGYENPPAVVSGLAYGIDAAAHKAALKAGLRTVAVLGNRLPRIYPSDNYGLARAIVSAGGCVVSELHENSPEGKMNFVARNRIIAGMSGAVLVVESPLKGGSMITADLAAGYDRTVMAVPGRLTDANSAGTNFLIRRLKAVAVTGVSDIAEETGLEKRKDRCRIGDRVGAVDGGYSEPVPTEASTVPKPDAGESGRVTTATSRSATDDMSEGSGCPATAGIPESFQSAFTSKAVTSGEAGPLAGPGSRVKETLAALNLMQAGRTVIGATDVYTRESSLPGNGKNAKPGVIPVEGNTGGEEIRVTPLPETESENNNEDGTLSTENLKALVARKIGQGDGITVDILAQKTGRPAQSLTAVLFELELDGVVRKAPGGTYMKV